MINLTLQIPAQDRDIACVWDPRTARQSTIDVNLTRKFILGRKINDNESSDPRTYNKGIDWFQIL